MFDRDRWQEIYSTLKGNKLRTFMTAFRRVLGYFHAHHHDGLGKWIEEFSFRRFPGFCHQQCFYLDQANHHTLQGTCPGADTGCLTTKI